MLAASELRRETVEILEFEIGACDEMVLEACTPGHESLGDIIGRVHQVAGTWRELHNIRYFAGRIQEASGHVWAQFLFIPQDGENIAYIW